MKHPTQLLKIFLITSWLFACTNIPTSVQPIPTEVASPTIASTSTLPQSDSSIQMMIIAMPQMHKDRAAHTATRLSNGTVLFVGGFTNGEQALNSAEIFDPETNFFLPTGAMSVTRQSHTATLLPDGKVLIAGGFNGDYLKSTEVYDPATGLFTPSGEMKIARSGHIAIMLNNGKVLIAGGTGEGWTFLESAELYNPEAGTFSLTGSMTVPRESHTATLLPNGNVLITGGHQGRRTNIVIYDSAELYDSVTGIFSETGKMTAKRQKHDATLLVDGRVFVSGGSDERDSEGAYRSTEIYDPNFATFTSAGEMYAARYKHTGTSLLLKNGQIFLIGGANTAEVFDPQRGKFSKITESVGATRLFATTTLLLDGSVLYAGGYGANITSNTTTWILKFAPAPAPVTQTVSPQDNKQ
ncbi:MAG: kelch repeat-containing protein [Anaerolineae bacterium]